MASHAVGAIASYGGGRNPELTETEIQERNKKAIEKMVKQTLGAGCAPVNIEEYID